MRRRQFVSLLAGALPIANSWRGLGQRLPDGFSVRTLTRGPSNHFFGYYGMSPWNRSETALVCLESPFQDRLPEPDEPALIGRVDPATGDFEAITETLAWNLQQGCLLHWNPTEPEREIVYNDRAGSGVAGTILNVETGSKRLLSRAISGVGRTAPLALSLSYGRVGRLRRVVGYSGLEDPNPSDPHPADDGVFVIDLATGEERLSVSIRDVFEQLVGHNPELRDRHMWFNHTVLNPSGTRFFFLARTRDPDGRLQSAMMTASIDGSDLREVIPYGWRVSHFDWRSDREIIATFRLDGEDPMRHVLFHDGQRDYRIVGEGFLLGDGHCSFAPDGRRLVTDRKHGDSLSQSLWLFDVEAESGLLLTQKPMHQRRFISGDTRCDFHPRWSPSGTAICFDALDTRDWTRQLHIVDFV